MPRTTALLALFALSTAACAPARFESVVRTSVAQRADYCGGEVAVKEDGNGYRASACGETHYYRRFFQRRSEGRTQCCQEVGDEGEAKALVSAPASRPVCRDF